MSNLSEWNHQATSGDAFVPILHDCVATEIRQDGSELSLYFPDGFWLHPNDPRNPYDEPRRTGPSLVVVSLGFPKAETDLENAIYPELFHRHRICRGVGFTTVTYPRVSDLIDKVNSGKWRLDFNAKYTCYDTGYFVICSFHIGKKYYDRDCYLTVACRQIRYCWNEVAEAPPW